MKKMTKNISLIVASSMLFNQTLLATTMADRNVNALDLADITAADIAEAEKTVKDLQIMVEQIDKLRKDLVTKMNSEEKDPVLKYINTIQTGLLFINSASVTAHLQSKERTNIALVTAAVTAICDMIVRHYKAGETLTAANIQSMISETSSNLLQHSKPSKELTAALTDLSQLSNEISANNSQLVNAIKAMGGSSDAVAVGTVAYVILHFVAPKLAKEGDEAIKTFLPKLQELSNKALTTTKGGFAATNLGSNAVGVLGMAAGYNSEEARQLVRKIMINLDRTQASLTQQISTTKNK
ncbi:MAG: hypothetical protein ACK4VO_07515 [Pseudobdellovibrio sp.]